MSNWKTGYPQTNAGPNRRINEEIAEEEEGVVATNFLAAALNQSSVQTLATGTTTITWSETALGAPYDATTQPLATVASSTNVTLTTAGVFRVTASVTVRDDVTAHAPDTNDRFCNLYLYWRDVSAGATHLIAQSNPFHYGPDGGDAGVSLHAGGTLSATLRMDSTDYVYVVVENFYDQTAAYLTEPSGYITIEKISD